MVDVIDESEETSRGSMPFLEHLEELRWRLLKSFLTVVFASLAAFYFRVQIFTFLVVPLGTIKLHVTEVTGSFYAFLKVSLIVGILAATPVVFYQLWSFVSPGLYREEKGAVLPLVAVSTLLFLAGSSFCYYIVLPFSLKFLIGFSGDMFSPIITVGSYLTFSGMLLMAFGFGFEIPVVGYFFGRVGVLSSSFMAKGRRYAVVLILVAAAILTPTPDVATQMMLAGPLYLLYEITIVIVRRTGRIDRKRRAEAGKAIDGQS
jgi:sec-independent protein translocase protein TatC